MVSLPWILNGWDQVRMNFITPTSLNSIPHSIQTNWKLCEKTDAKMFAFSHSCDLEWKSRSIRLVPNEESKSIQQQTKFEPNPFLNVWMHANISNSYFPHFIPDQPKSVWENEAKRFCFVLTLWPKPQSRSVKVVSDGESQWCLQV